MASGVFDMALQRDLWSTAELREIFGEQARVQRWFDYEAALALAQASLGLVPEAAAREIAQRAREGVIDVERIGAEARVARHPLVPALRALARRCGGDNAQWLHHGPTTQDVLDTGTVLQLRDAHAVFLRDLGRVGGELARLAARYRDSPMPGRTHAVHALPPGGRRLRRVCGRVQALFDCRGCVQHRFHCDSRRRSCDKSCSCTVMWLWPGPATGPRHSTVPARKVV